MIQSLFIMATVGEVIIEKHWRGITARSVCDFFWDEVNKYANKSDVPPIPSPLTSAAATVAEVVLCRPNSASIMSRSFVEMAPSPVRS